VSRFIIGLGFQHRGIPASLSISKQEELGLFRFTVSNKNFFPSIFFLEDFRCGTYKQIEIINKFHMRKIV